jgi:hypothetical protein
LVLSCVSKFLQNPHGSYVPNQVFAKQRGRSP